MNVLVLGSGGREHTLAWKISQSPKLSNLFIAPGNGGTESVGTNIDLSPENLEDVKKFVLENHVDIVVVGPEKPLVEGIRDFFKKDPDLQHVYLIGPSGAGARLEGSKDFANQFMEKYQIPTADFKSFTEKELEEGYNYLEQLQPPYVLKSDGLAAGKGVVILDSLEEAKNSLKELLSGKFGDASKTVVIEEFLNGKELSVFIATDGENYKLLPAAKDYKRAGEGDTGLNTGGMGAVSPVSYADDDLMTKIREKIIEPTLKGLRKENIEYTGFLYFGLMKVGNEPYVIEYNVRLGDPETQAVLPRVECDFIDLFKAIEEKKLNEIEVSINPYPSATVILASEGYPGKYEKGKKISIYDKFSDVMVFHAGTKKEKGELFSNGGRVMGVTSMKNNFKSVFASIYEQINHIEFEGMYYRRDIGMNL